MNWQKVDNAIKQLKSKITEKPDIIIGIVRGGLIPARLLAKCLDVNEMYALTVKKIGDERVVTSEINEDINGRSILLVEDVLETGTSIIVAMEYLKSKGANVKTASIYYQPKTQIMPDYYVSEKDGVPTFPWD